MSNLETNYAEKNTSFEFVCVHSKAIHQNSLSKHDIKLLEITSKQYYTQYFTIYYMFNSKICSLCGFSFKSLYEKPE